jgi:hypothetical protein
MRTAKCLLRIYDIRHVMRLIHACISNIVRVPFHFETRDYREAAMTVALPSTPLHHLHQLGYNGTTISQIIGFSSALPMGYSSDSCDQGRHHYSLANTHVNACNSIGLKWKFRKLQFPALNRQTKYS